MDLPLRIGAVAYDPRVVSIWEGMQGYLEHEAGLAVDIELFLSYAAQVRALLDGRIDIGWNTNLAYVQSVRWSEGRVSAVAMRDTDRGWRSVIVSLAHGPVGDLPSLRGKTLALGSRDSGHAAILPLYFLEQQGLRPRDDFRPEWHDKDVGKHGDTGTSELEAVRAVLGGHADAAAVGAPFWERMKGTSALPRDALRSIWRSPPFNHCMFTGRAGLEQGRSDDFAAALRRMSWENPRHREILQAEGLRRWMEPDTGGYESLTAACERQALFERR